ncbi:MAG TPA: rhodanese-like domain-containing protein [Bacteroidales bacterium]|nr:rhodanese-like domain-containing protein [Bacteroidales bacterium]
MTDLFSDLGFAGNGIRHISAREAFYAVSKGAVLVDIREEYHTSMKTFKVDNYLILPQSIFEENIINLPKDRPLIIADASGIHSKAVAEKLLKNGYTLVANLAGGIMDWERDGFPVQKDPARQLSGQCPCMLKPVNRTKKIDSQYE